MSLDLDNRELDVLIRVLTGDPHTVFQEVLLKRPDDAETILDIVRQLHQARLQ